MVVDVYGVINSVKFNCVHEHTLNIGEQLKTQLNR